MAFRPDAMERALSLSARALETPGTEPFGAVVVQDGRIVGEGLNHAQAHCDPTSHGEIEAIRAACKSLDTLDLSDCEIYTTCEPCAMCVAAIALTRIPVMYYAASLEDCRQAVAGRTLTGRPKVEIAVLRREAASTIEERSIEAHQKNAGDALRILEAWAARSDET